MAITIVSQPTNYGRCYDTNRLMYKISSDNSTQPNFRFYIKVYVGDITQNPVTYTDIATVRKRPLTDGTAFFNPAELWSNYLDYDITINVTDLTEALSSNGIFYLGIYEEYGNTPSIQNATLTTSTPIMLYNSIQEYIPYDIDAYGGGNLQWVMSGLTITQYSWVNVGTYASDSTILFNGDGSITGLTSIEIPLIDDNSNDVEAKLDSMDVDSEYVLFIDPLDTSSYFIITFSTKTKTTTGVTLTDITFQEKGSHLSNSGFTPSTDIEVRFTEYTASLGQGRYLTDALNYQVDTYDYANLYFIASSQDKPAYCRVTVKYWNTGVQPPPTSGWIPQINPGNYLTNFSTGGGSGAPQSISKLVNTAESAPNPPITDIGDADISPFLTGSTDRLVPGETPTPEFQPYISQYVTGFTLTYTNLNNQMFYIGVGPKEMSDLGMFSTADANGGWIAYKIELTDSRLATKKYNKYDMWYYRKNKCSKYGPIQLFWLNPHGGFDRYTFYKKNYVSYDIERTLWQHRFSDTYTLGERGTTVYKTKANQSIRLNTDYLTASETQILSQLMMSPEVYAVYEYQGNVFTIPYLVEDGEFEYKELKNEKVAVMEVTIYPAWNRVSQTS